MRTYVTVTLVSDRYEVQKVDAETLSRVRTKGTTVTIWESNDQNDEYCELLARLMNESNLNTIQP